MMTYRTITAAREATSYFQQLRERGVETIALDLEGEYNLHQYGEKLCLIQIYDGTDLVAVDPFGLNAEQIKLLMENDSILKVMYDSLSDQALLQKCYGSRIASIFDLRPASDLLQFERQDLGSVLEQTIGVRIEKKKKFQRYNWTRRPIEQEAVEYALSDVLHLPALKDKLISMLSERRLLDTFWLRNLKVQNRDFTTDRRPRLFKTGEFLRLSKEQKGLFERAYDVRDKHACALNLPPDMVVTKDQMFKFASGQVKAEGVATSPRVPATIRERLITELRALL